MLSFEQARALVLTDVSVVGTERVPLFEGAGRVLRREVRARGPFPSFSASTMDGYAVSTESFRGPGPWRLPVKGESRMGSLPSPLVDAATCRIFTGAGLPDGADAVIMQEDVLREGDVATFTTAPEPGAFIRYLGDDLQAGDLALTSATRLGPSHLALAASLDYPEITVSVRPRVTILCTGDELRAPGEPARPGSIADSNAVGLRAMAEQAGARVRVAPLVPDDSESTRAAIEEALLGTDLLVTVGGVSVGDHDLVRPALERAGVTLDFWKVAIKPGKPLALGRCGATRVLALPGNPASAMVTFALFGLPLLRVMQGDARPLPQMLSLPLAAEVLHKTGRLEFMRGTLETRGERLAIRPLDNQASGAITSMAWADALAAIPEDKAVLPEGTLVAVLRFADA